MGDDIYTENLPCKANVLIPKLNGLSMLKTGSDSALKGTSGHKNGYIHHNEVKSSRSGSQIKFINAAIYVEKVDLSSPAFRSYSRGDGKHEQVENSSKNLGSDTKDELISTLKFKNHVNGLIGNGAGDRFSSPVTRHLKPCGPCKIPCENNETDENLIENIPATTRDSESSFESFQSSSVEENSSCDSYSVEVTKVEAKTVDKYVEKPVIPSVEEQKHLFVSEEIKNPIKTLPRLFYRSYSNLDRGTAMPISGRSISSEVDKSAHSPCSTVAVPRRYSTRLSDTLVSTFPEKNIRKKIQSALAEKGDIHFVTIECKGLLPHNWENLIAFEDLAWFRWYTLKLEQERQRKQAERNFEVRKREVELKQKNQRLCKKKIESDTICAWIERKEKEAVLKKKETTRRLELERQKKEEEKERIQALAQRARQEWNRRKEIEKKEQKLKEEQQRQKFQEEKALRALKNKEAFEAWSEKAKKKPRPMSVSIKDHKGKSDPALAHLNWNPIPWKNIVEESKTSIPKDPGKRRPLLIKPSST